MPVQYPALAWGQSGSNVYPVAITNIQNGPVVWMQAVTDEEYNSR
jgi:hypothetical protein